MFIVIQYPFADMRDFLIANGWRLSKPWLLSNPNVDFVRASGLIMDRRQGGVEEWAGEEIYGDASLALRLPNFLKQSSSAHLSGNSAVSHVFRRFYSNGVTSRMDVGFKINPQEKVNKPKCIIASNILGHLTTLPARARTPKGYHPPRPLIEVGNMLAQHFLNATTDRKRVKGKVYPWWFSAGEPVVIFECPKRIPLQLPKHCRHILTVPNEDITILHARLNINKKNYSCWFMIVGDGDPDAVRRVRIHLGRLHAECESVKQVLVNLYKEKDWADSLDSIASDLLQNYINTTISLIEKPKRFGIQNRCLLAVARTAIKLAPEGRITSLVSMRRQVKAKIERYIMESQSNHNKERGIKSMSELNFKHISIGGDFNFIAGNNSGNFNKSSGSTPSELQEKLKHLSDTISDLTARLEKNDAEEASKKLDLLLTEAGSRNPNKAQYERHAETLIHLAQKTAELAEPVTTAIQAVIKLLH